MAKSSSKKKSSKKSSDKKSLKKPLSPSTKRWLWVLTLFVLSAYTLLIWIGRGGLIGEPAYNALYYLVGEAYFLIPISLAGAAVSIIYSFSHKI